MRLRNAALVFLVAIDRVVLLRQELLRLADAAGARRLDRGAAGTSRCSVFTSPTEPFWVYTKLAMYGALLVASPFIFWELWKFVAPGLYKQGEADGAAGDARDRRLLRRRRAVRLRV